MTDRGRRQLVEGAARLGLVLAPSQIGALEEFLYWLTGEGRLLGVTGHRVEKDQVRELLLDPLAAGPYLPPGAWVADLGSGGGVPGVPLALVRPDLRFVLVESSQKKAAFLGRLSRVLGLETRLTVQARRAEQLGRDPEYRGRFEAVVAKGLAPLRVLLEYALPLLRVGGVLVAHKGPALARELDQARRALRALRGEVREVIPYDLQGRSYRLCRVVKMGETPARYPRRVGVPSRQPL